MTLDKLTKSIDPAETEPDSGAFAAQCAALLAQTPPGLIAGHSLHHIPCDAAPWVDTGIDLEPGTEVTTLAVGRTWLAPPLDIWVGAHFQLWMRIGTAGPVFRGTRRSHSFSGGAGGRLYLASYFPSEWADPSGSIASDPGVYSSVQGTLTVLVIRWAGDAATGVQALAGKGDVDGLLAGEAERLQANPAPPSDWSYLWFLGPAEIYRREARAGESSRLVCRTHRDVGILQRDVSVALTPETRLRWRWKIDALPSALREDTIPSHDYLSIALAFDNGQDLTWYWSVSLPPGMSYRCPLPTWQHRETHWVVRSGLDGLGQWFSEDRPVHADYAAAIGMPPARITQVWLIANSLFQRRLGQCEYADIVISGPDGEVAVG